MHIPTMLSFTTLLTLIAASPLVQKHSTGNLPQLHRGIRRYLLVNIHQLHNGFCRLLQTQSSSVRFKLCFVNRANRLHWSLINNLSNILSNTFINSLDRLSNFISSTDSKVYMSHQRKLLLLGLSKHRSLLRPHSHLYLHG